MQNPYSDNSTNFVGVNRELKLLYLQHKRDYAKIINTMAEGLTWHFIPPNSPHFGGLWEAAVKSVKQHLRRIIANASLGFEELYTLLVQIESILNSRPLTPMSRDPNDLSYLTPAHFLIGDLLTTVPEPRLTEIQVNRLSRWQHIEMLRQQFWKRWHTEYSSTSSRAVSDHQR